MKIVFDELGTAVDFKEFKVFSLVIENSKLFYAFGKDLFVLNDGGNGKTEIYQDDECLQFDKHVLLVYNYYDINLNQPKLSSFINKTIEGELVHGDYIQELREINERVRALNQKLVTELDLPITFAEEIAIDKYVKFSAFEAKQEIKLCENILTHIELLSKIKKIKLIVLINPFMYLGKKAIEQLIRDLDYQDANVLLVNSYEKYQFNQTGRMIIDEDLCVF